MNKTSVSYIKQALISAISGVVCLFIADRFKLPQGYWAVISTIVVMQSDVEATIAASWNRLGGTAVGALVGGIFFALGGHHMATFAMAIAVVVLICLSLGFKDSYRLGGVTAAIVILTGQASAPWLTAIYRFTEVSLGIVVALLISALIYPKLTFKHMCNSVIQILNGTKKESSDKKNYTD